MSILPEIYEVEGATDPEGWKIYGLRFRVDDETGYYVRVPPGGKIDKDGELCILGPGMKGRVSLEEKEP